VDGYKLKNPIVFPFKKKEKGACARKEGKEPCGGKKKKKVGCAWLQGNFKTRADDIRRKKKSSLLAKEKNWSGAQMPKKKSRQMEEKDRVEILRNLSALRKGRKQEKKKKQGFFAVEKKKRILANKKEMGGWKQSAAKGKGFAQCQRGEKCRKRFLGRQTKGTVHLGGRIQFVKYRQGRTWKREKGGQSLAKKTAGKNKKNSHSWTKRGVTHRGGLWKWRTGRKKKKHSLAEGEKKVGVGQNIEKKTAGISLKNRQNRGGGGKKTTRTGANGKKKAALGVIR